jgi:hypothetical protein
LRHGWRRISRTLAPTLTDRAENRPAPPGAKVRPSLGDPRHVEIKGDDRRVSLVCPGLLFD